MTREEAIKELEQTKDYPISEPASNEALEMAIIALRKELILEQIRAEILVLDDANYDFEGYYKAVTDALKIIDKYKAESEG